MFLFSIPLLLVALFLLLTLVVAFMSGKATTFRAYAVDNKRVSTFRLLATVVATAFDSISVIYIVKVGYFSVDLVTMIFMFTNVLLLWFMSLLWVHMAPFMSHFSVIETIGYAYGKYLRMVAALFCIFISIYMICRQINMICFIMDICIESIDPRKVAIWVAFMVMAYSALGGICSVTNTDVLQGITCIAIIFFIVKLMFLKTNQSILEIVSFLYKKKFTFNSLFHSDVKRWQFLLYLPTCALWTYDPVLIQRMYMCSSPVQVKKVFLYSSLIGFFIVLFLCLIGLFVFVASPTSPVTEVWQYIVTNMPSCLSGLVVIGVLGMAMSTADSYLHLCAVLVGHDLMESIPRAKPISDRLKIKVAKWTIVMVSLLVMVLTQYSNHLFMSFGYFWDKMYAYILGFCQSSVCPLFLLAVFGFRGSSHTAFIGMIIFLLFYWMGIHLGFRIKMVIVVMSSIASVLSILAAHYLLPQSTGKGWVGLNAQQKRLVALTGLFRRFKKKIHIE